MYSHYLPLIIYYLLLIFAKANYNYSKRAKNVRETVNMKRCPQCNRVFEDNLAFCTDDGATLVEETFVLPSESSPTEEEEETVIHHEPIKIEIPDASPTTEQPFQPQPEKVIPVIVERPGNTGKYFLVLIIGLFLGGALVLGLLVLIYSQLRNPTNSNQPVENIQLSSGKHAERNKTRKDSEFNGFVLSESANIRSAPNGTVLDSLPNNDRLSIEERDGTWYRVICEHGVSGWMHGNTIRFNDNETPF